MRLVGILRGSERTVTMYGVHGCPLSTWQTWNLRSLLIVVGPWWFLLVPDENFHRGLSPFEFPGGQNLVASTTGVLALSFWCRFTLAMAESGGLLNYYATYLPNQGADPHLDRY
jgi:hypothetical protein